MKKYFWVLCLLIFSYLDSNCQALIKIDKQYHDFGEIKEGDPASYEFDVVNTGKEPLIIAGVKPSCGCTTPDWTKTPIAPGGKGIIKATYGTEGRPGVFNKSITVTSNAEDTPSLILYIKGNVLKKGQKIYTPEELRMSPKIILEKNQLNFGTVEKNTKIPYKIQVKNLGRTDLRIADIISACNCIKVNSKPEYIKSGESGVIDLIYSPNILNNTEDIVIIKSNDLTSPSVNFVFKGKVVENINSPSIVKENKISVPFK